MKRNGFIDVIKFFFAIVIAEFHLNSGVFPGGRMGVEVFFMINGYLMMRSLAKDPSRENVASSTAKFIWRKYKGLFFYLLPAALINYFVICAAKEWTIEYTFVRLPLLTFDIIPLHQTGLLGEYAVGISWYLSAMFLALAILYPFCKKFRRGFSLMVCPIIGVLGYGTLSHYFRSLAANTQYVPETIIRAGLLRGIACCALGCFLYEVCQRFNDKTPTKTCRVIFTVLELLGYTYMAYIMHHYYKTIHEYVLVFVIFGLLFIGINGLSLFSYLWRFKWTKCLGTASTLIVLCHACWIRYLEKELGKGFQNTAAFWWYPLAIFLSCVFVYASSILLKLLFAQLKKIKLWQSPAK